MRVSLIAGLVALIATNSSFAEDHVFTLYRNSVTDIRMRVHIATLDTSEGRAYNSENCLVAAKLFRSQPGVSVNYWCEAGRYRKDW